MTHQEIELSAKEQALFAEALDVGHSREMALEYALKSREPLDEEKLKAFNQMMYNRFFSFQN